MRMCSLQFFLLTAELCAACSLESVCTTFNYLLRAAQIWPPCHCLYCTETWIKSVSLLMCMPSQQCSHCKYVSKTSPCFLPMKTEQFFAPFLVFITLWKIPLKVTFICQLEKIILSGVVLNYRFWDLWSLHFIFHFRT